MHFTLKRYSVTGVWTLNTFSEELDTIDVTFVHLSFGKILDLRSLLSSQLLATRVT